LSVESLMHLPGNEECADCCGLEPEWASVNQGTVICIDCAGVHRSLGVHISKVKSLRLDSWLPEEMRVFQAQGGNTAVNKRLAGRAGRFAPSARNSSYPAFLVRPDGTGGKRDISEYIRRKYHATGASRAPAAPAPEPASSSAAAVAAGRQCFQGVCFAEVVGIEISDERARDLRILGAMFLSLSVTMSLGTMIAEPTSAKRGSAIAAWEPPERRELLWDCQEPWLWCRVFDGAELMGLGTLAAEGRLDLRLLGDETNNVEVSLDLFASGGEDSDDENGPASNRGRSRRGHGYGAPPGYFAEAAPAGPGYHQDVSDPASLGACCGVAHLRITVVNMSSMDSGKKPEKRAQGQGQGARGPGAQQQMARQNDGADFWQGLQLGGIPAMLGLAPSGQPDRTGRPPAAGQPDMACR